MLELVPDSVLWGLLAFSVAVAFPGIWWALRRDWPRVRTLWRGCGESLQWCVAIAIILAIYIAVSVGLLSPLIVAVLLFWWLVS